ncbi:hypothetical protein TNCV_3476861 [Trichonephila clavipes]|nr:hypothetical protein TNCV_3476861 [Trichonephila clavipes]
MKSLVYASPVNSNEALVVRIAVVAGEIREMPEWPNCSVSRFRTTDSRFYPRTGQGQLRLSTLLQRVDK